MSPAAFSIVIAEDDDGHATLVRRNLRRGGWLGDPVVVRDGQEALDYMYRRGEWIGRPQHDAVAILLDLNMPRLGGLEVLRHLKQDPVLSRLPVFILTTTDNPLELDRCYAAGASACIVKPVEATAFSAAIQQFAQFLLTVVLPSDPPPAGPGHVH